MPRNRSAWPVIAVLLLWAVDAQAQGAARPAARSTVRRAGTPEEIAAARATAVRALTGSWDSASQGVLPSDAPCELRLGTQRRALDLVTTDVQIVDVGSLAMSFQDVRDLTVEGVRISLTKSTQYVTRRRTLTLEGVQRPERVERASSLLVLGDSQSAGRMDRVTAVMEWSIKCEPK